MSLHLPLVLSPSQANQYDTTQDGGCNRKWAWRYIEHIKEPDKASAAKGTRTHKQYELLLNGMSMDYSTPAMREAAEIAIPGLVNLPQPFPAPSVWPIPEEEQEQRNRIMRIEQPFLVVVPNGPNWRGVKDLEVPDSAVIPGCSGGVPGVIDHKTTKAARYVKTTEQLLKDPQANVYAHDAMAKYVSTSVDVVYNYVFTEGSRRTTRVHLRMHKAPVEEVFSRLRILGNEIAVTYSARPNPLDLPANKLACDKFGGCPYVGLCTDLHSGPMGHLTPEQENNMTQSGAELMAKIEASNKAEDKATGVTVPGVTNMPPGFTIPAFLIAPAAAPAPVQMILPPAIVPPTVVAINPPESTLPPLAAAESTPVAEKPKRTRRTKAQMEADSAARPVDPQGAGAMDATINELVAQSEAPGLYNEEFVTDLVPPPVGFTLYIDCIPQGVVVKNASAFIADAKKIVQEKLNVADYRFEPWGKGQGALVAAVSELTSDNTTDIVLDSRTPEGLLVLEDLTAKAARVVRGLR